MEFGEKIQKLSSIEIAHFAPLHDHKVKDK